MIFLFRIGFLEVTWIDILDILLVSWLLFQLYKLMKGSIAVKIFLGFLSLYLIYLVVRAAQMELLTSILGTFMSVGVLAIIILFAPEIRKFLLVIGKSTPFSGNRVLKNLFKKNKDRGNEFDITPVMEACRNLSGTNTGALIVFAGSSELKFYAESGDIIDAEISKRLLISIFNKNSPLHDGAVIISNNRVKAARAILPVTENENLPANFGLRHRAAIGMTENTDALVVVVSEETGQISVAKNGRIMHNLTLKELRRQINDFLFGEGDLFERSQFDILHKEEEKNTPPPMTIEEKAGIN